MRRLPALLASALVLSLGLSFAAPPARAAGGELTVFAAASLTDALEELTVAYEKTGGEHVALNLGASSALARQIVAGAPADLFASADEAKMDDLEKRGLLLAGTRRDLLSNTLVVVVSAASTLRLSTPADLTGPQVHRLALADPSAVPVGIYAKEYLQKRGVWDRVSGRVVPTA